MQVIRAARPEEFAWSLVRPVVAIGTMDGVHLGHQAVLASARELAAALHGTAAVLTFAQHPLEVVRPAEAPAVITPLPLKLLLLEGCGMEAALAIEFSAAMAAVEAEAFVSDILFKRLGVAGLAVGHDFGFGRGRRGTVTLLTSMAASAGVSLVVVPPVRLGEQVVSSRHVRGLLAAGQVAEARRFLGRPFAVLGQGQPGAGRGRGLGFPTANLALLGRPVLKDGVYAGRVLVRGEYRDAVMNLGVAPTFGAGARRLEIHIAGWAAPLYGERLVVYILERLRDEARFPDAAALKSQLERDLAAAEAVWEAARGLPWPEWTLQA
ncbi:MAG: riboflavin biosynthesis protein RibF [candidate division NC10 bacterium]|nr:riboflavin biosynthesis protein RibF [candidate division NC10 bacterium]